MKKSRLNPNYRDNASRLHKAVGDMLKKSEFTRTLNVYQEYPVNKVTPYFDSGREKFDWIILNWNVVIECHGEQHYFPVCFGGISQEEAKRKFEAQQLRDEAKKEAVTKAGWTYIIFKYDEDVTFPKLIQKIDEAAPETQVITPVKPRKTRTPWQRENLKRAKEYRKKRYKEWKQSQR